MLAMSILCEKFIGIEETTKILSKIPGLRWKPGVPKYFANKTMSQIKANLLQQPRPYVVKQPIEQINKSLPLKQQRQPLSFDWSELYPHCINHIRDQGNCGSCWAFAVVATFGDTRCLYGLDQQYVQYSEQFVVSCDWNDYGCSGGYLSNAWWFLYATGTVTDLCVPYSWGYYGYSSTCPYQCINGLGLWQFQTQVDTYQFACWNYDYMMQCILYGPISTSFDVYEDFFSYESGIYYHVYGNYIAGHAVEIVGYGVYQGMEYWKAKSSWGENWGESGYFRIMRGMNECNFESDCYVINMK